MAGSAGFGKTKRLLNAQDFSRVFDSADARAHHKHLMLLARANDLATHRLGLVIAKKNVRLAVDRNRLKRVAREFFRQLPEGEPGLDVVLLARRGAGELDNEKVSSILQQLWQKLESQTRNAHSSQD
ncbi:MAG: ribonuclease P protein component [Halioglobus sp.]|nr:ribonuclease P protein component [Halioglobus sp.]